MASAAPETSAYRGRLAPSPTGYLHLGHARTFWTAFERARACGGALVLRNEDLDRDRVRPEFVTAFLQDLRWLGIHWQEGPDLGGPRGPYDQSARLAHYRTAFETLRATGHLFPCTCSRRDIQSALNAPHAGDEEPLYPGTCREASVPDAALRTAWRFRVPAGREVAFEDGAMGPQRYRAGAHFGDFVVWRQDGLPSYQLACAVDDHAMQITEVVRGADLLVSTARQILLHEALGQAPPRYHHCPLMTDAAGQRLAKRHDALSLRALRNAGRTPEQIRQRFGAPAGPE
ncbi:MAG: tRNA glutamyl-Q(34) synthetase GluQRS [Verrucomicrobia bacterium]|nr:tRNA glutamyl-Q(34) synthetase GluQRS [Verrucomicrobiota bacterium]